MRPLRLLGDVPPTVVGNYDFLIPLLSCPREQSMDICASTPTEHSYSEASLDFSNAVALDHASPESSESDIPPSTFSIFYRMVVAEGHIAAPKDTVC